MTYTTWIFVSDITKSFYLTTHVKFEDMNLKQIQNDIKTWKRKDNHQYQLDQLAESSDFRIEYDEVCSTSDLKQIKSHYVNRGYKCLTFRIQLVKKNEIVG